MAIKKYVGNNEAVAELIEKFEITMLKAFDKRILSPLVATIMVGYKISDFIKENKFNKEQKEVGNHIRKTMDYFFDNMLDKDDYDKYLEVRGSIADLWAEEWHILHDEYSERNGWDIDLTIANSWLNSVSKLIA